MDIADPQIVPNICNGGLANKMKSGTLAPATRNDVDLLTLTKLGL